MIDSVRLSAMAPTELYEIAMKAKSEGDEKLYKLAMAKRDRIIEAIKRMQKDFNKVKAE